MSFKARLKELKDIIDSSSTPVLHAHRLAIFNRLLGYIEQSNGDDRWVYKKTIAEDWPAFCALELTTKEGIPLFLSPWQTEVDEAIDTSDDMTILAARQVGKTTQAASEYLKRMMRYKNRRVLHFAPTVDQLVVVDTLMPFVQNSAFIMREYDAVVNAWSLEFRANGSMFEAINLNETGGNSDKKRGNNGTDIGIDEFQMMSSTTWEKIVQPMLSNQMAGVRRIIKWGTMTDKYRPDFGMIIDNARRAGKQRFFTVNAWQAVDQGIRSPDKGPGSMKQRFIDLNIPCEYVLGCGVCPRYLPHYFEELEDKVPARELLKIQPDEFECNLVCSRNNAYLEEDMALMGTSDGRFFPDAWLDQISKPYRFWTPAEAERAKGQGVRIVASADLGQLQDPTVIVIYKVFTGKNVAGQDVQKLQVVGWEVVEPFNKASDKEPSWDRVVAAIKRVNQTYGIQQWYIDTTRNISIIRELCTGVYALERGAIFANEAAQKQESRGIWWSGEFKSLMFNTHQQNVADERIIVPDAKHEPQFHMAFSRDHRNVVRLRTSPSGYDVFNDTGHLVDSMVMGSLALKQMGTGPALMDFEFLTADFDNLDDYRYVPGVGGRYAPSALVSDDEIGIE